MKASRHLFALVLLPLATLAADRPLKIDRARTFIDVDVNATMNFSGHLDVYDAQMTVDDTGKVRSGIFQFKFSDLKTGKTDRDADMIKWLGGATRWAASNSAIWR